MKLYWLSRITFLSRICLSFGEDLFCHLPRHRLEEHQLVVSWMSVVSHIWHYVTMLLESIILTNLVLWEIMEFIYIIYTMQLSVRMKLSKLANLLWKEYVTQQSKILESCIFILKWKISETLKCLESIEEERRGRGQNGKWRNVSTILLKTDIHFNSRSWPHQANRFIFKQAFSRAEMFLLSNIFITLKDFSLLLLSLDLLIEHTFKLWSGERCRALLEAHEVHSKHKCYHIKFTNFHLFCAPRRKVKYSLRHCSDSDKLKAC